MKYGIIVNGRVTEPVTIPSPLPSWAGNDSEFLAKMFPGKNGWISVPDDAVPGTIANDDGTYTNPENAPPTARAPVTLLGFLRLCQNIGGMTDEMLVACKENAAFAAFWIKFTVAEEIICDDKDTDDGLAALELAGYLPNGASAVKAAWPAIGNTNS